MVVKRKLRVILCYKNFQANKNISHIGLGVAALNTCRVLIEHQIRCEVWPVLDPVHLRKLIQDDFGKPCHEPITHLVVSAPWIPTTAFHELSRLFPTIHFAMNCHSNVGFLQADPQGIKLLREDLELEMSLPNFSVAANSRKMCEWVKDAYSHPCEYLPNLYYLNDLDRSHRPLWSGGVLRIGCFGAIRPQKNLASAVAASIEVAHQLKTHTEIWISSGRAEGGGQTILNTVREMCRNLPSTTLHEAGWQSWPTFRRLVGSMHLLLQPSYTESFNMVTADGVCEGVPSVVSEAIDWVPHYWKSHFDDVFEIAHVARSLLFNHHAARDGRKFLRLYVEEGLQAWKQYLRKTLKF